MTRLETTTIQVVNPSLEYLLFKTVCINAKMKARSKHLACARKAGFSRSGDASVGPAFVAALT